MALLLQLAGTFVIRQPNYSVRITITWNNFYTQNLLTSTLLPTGPVVRAPYFTPPKGYPPAAPPWVFGTPLTLRSTPPTPVGEQIYDLPPNSYPEPATRTWLWSYNLNLRGQDSMIVGDMVTDLPPRAYPEPATRTWVWSYNLNLIGKDQFPPGEQRLELPIPPENRPLRSWTWSYNLNLIGQDQLPPGEIIYDRPPVGPYYPDHLRTWIGSKTSEIIAVKPFSQTDWPLNFGYIQPLRSWTWNYNLNLIAQDAFPPGEIRTELARGPEQPLRSWTWNYNLNLIGQDALTVGKQIYDLPPLGAVQTPYRSWVWSYNLNLIGQDKFPAGKQIYDRPPLGDIQTPFRSWTWNYNLNLIGKDQLPVGEQVYDRPPTGYDYRPPRSWTHSYNLNLIGQDRLPVGVQRTELPVTTRRDIQTWINAVNIALTGQVIALPPGKQIYDLPPRAYPFQYATRAFGRQIVTPVIAIPPGQIVTDLPPRAHQYWNQNRTWIYTRQIGLVTPPTPRNQFDWPLPKHAQQPLRSWTWSYNLNLIAKDKLPVGKQVTDLTQRSMYAAVERKYDRGFGIWGGINLFPPPVIPPVPPPTPPVPSSLQPNPGLEWQWFDRFREPGPVGWR